MRAILAFLLACALFFPFTVAESVGKPLDATPCTSGERRCDYEKSEEMVCVGGKWSGSGDFCSKPSVTSSGGSNGIFGLVSDFFGSLFGRKPSVSVSAGKSFTVNDTKSPKEGAGSMGKSGINSFFDFLKGLLGGVPEEDTTTTTFNDNDIGVLEPKEGGVPGRQPSPNVPPKTAVPSGGCSSTDAGEEIPVIGSRYTEQDSPNDIYVKGTTEGELAGGAEDINGDFKYAGERGTFSDSCTSDGTQLREFQCVYEDGGWLADYKYVDCQKGCREGACSKEGCVSENFYDPDENEYYYGGTTSGMVYDPLVNDSGNELHEGEWGAFSDKCIDNETLETFYCYTEEDGIDRVGVDYIRCDRGCTEFSGIQRCQSITKIGRRPGSGSGSTPYPKQYSSNTTLEYD